jgi:hypothetical protein
MLITFAGCSSDDDNKGNPITPNDDNALTASNWNSVVKDVYDFNLTVPTGWTFKQGKKESQSPSYSIQFTTNADDWEAAWDEFMEYIFDLTANVTPAKGNYDGDGEKLEEIPTMLGYKMPIWNFDTPKRAIQIDLMDDSTTKTVQIYMVTTKTF